MKQESYTAMLFAKARYSALHEDNLGTLKDVLVVTSLHKY